MEKSIAFEIKFFLNIENLMVFMLILQSIIACGSKNLDFAGLSPDDLDK